jgi:glycosyltransferase involved in cell wall biosynthesis
VTEDPLVSVVTPFYNSARDLGTCIDSVLAQEYSNFEYLLVDNQSDDGSRTVAESYAERDQRIRLISTDRFLSQVENYNFALSHISADSRWCKVCQADDWLYPRCLPEMIAVGESLPSVGLVSSYSWWGDEILCQGLPHDAVVLQGRDVARCHLMGGPFLFGSPTTVLYRSDLVRARRPFYERDRLHEDTEVCYELLEQADFGFVHQILSYRSVDPHSISGEESDLLTRELDGLITFVRYGPQFLTAEELDSRSRASVERYYRRLAERLLRGCVTRSNAGLLDYQRRGLRSVDLRLSLPRLATGVAAVVGASLLSPVAAVRRLRGASSSS